MSTALAQNQGAPIVQVGAYSLAEVVQKQLWKDPTALEGKANVLFPITALDDLPPMMRPSLTVVHVKADPARREVYPVGDSKMGLSKPVIMKMLNAAGASVMTRKISDRADLDFIEWQATVSGYTPDGQFHQQTASKSWIWEKVKADKGGAQQRKFADEICETKAILRAARAFLNIQTSYTAQELALPFLIASAVPDLDPNDPDVKNALIAKATGTAGILYPDQAALPPMQEIEHESDPGKIINADFEDESETGRDSGAPQESRPAPTESYDPLAMPSEPVQDASAQIEAELDTKIRALVGEIGREAFGKVLAKHGVTGLMGASIDLKILVVETATAVKEGRLQL